MTRIFLSSYDQPRNLPEFAEVQISNFFPNIGTVLNIPINIMQISNFLLHKIFPCIISFRDYVTLALYKIHYIH